MKFGKMDFDSFKNEGLGSIKPMERRTFLKIGLAITGVYAGGKVLSLMSNGGRAMAYETVAENDKYRPHYSMVIRQNLCIDCERCVEACAKTNGVPSGGYRTRILEHDMPEAAGQKREYIPVLCNQCNNPPCTRACPTSATYKDPKTGIVLIDKDRCIGCKTCMLACPYNARYLNGLTKTVDKCNFCWDTRLSKGEELTACAAACPAGVRVFGDISDPLSEVYGLVYQLDKTVWVLRPETGVEPNVFYMRA